MPVNNEPLVSRSDIERLLQDRAPERDDLDFKRGIGETSTAARALAAMANTRGGTIVFGIVEQHSRAAGKNPIDLRGAAERVANVARDSIDEPLILADARPIHEQGDTGFLVIRVDASDRAPHLVNGQGFIRSGPTIRPVTVREMGELFARRGESFLREFRVQLKTPADVVAELETERSTEFDLRGVPRTRTRHELVLTNRGDADAQNVEFEFLTVDGKPAQSAHVVRQGPIRLLRSGTSVRIPVSFTMGPDQPSELKVAWEDEAGQLQEAHQSLGF
jgi:hypothetical protein